MNVFKKLCTALCTVFLAVSVFCSNVYAESSASGIPSKSPVKENWDDVSQWKADGDGKSTIDVKSAPACFGKGMEIKYILEGKDHGWVQVNKKIAPSALEDIPVVFLIKADATGNMEFKFIDSDGSNFGRKIDLKDKYKDWTQLVIYKKNLEYWWGGDSEYSGLSELSIAFAGKGNGKVVLDEIGFGAKGLTASFAGAGVQLDPDRELPGIGFRQRRDEKLIPEDPLVMEWLKQAQDVGTLDKQLVPSMEDDQISTFNNALVAMAFILKGERERAERILDFFSGATDKKNQDPLLQNFFYKKKPRGFFQYAAVTSEKGNQKYCNPGTSDRWMGDMAWLLTAYKYYEKKYESKKYKKITKLLKNLLISWYTDDPSGEGGYIRHGWRQGDSKLHETFGHPEGNIDAYAVLNLCGEEEYAKKIKTWLDGVCNGNTLPLDLYTWRVLAYGKEAVPLLNIPDYDLRYRKTLTVNGKKVTGFYHGPDINIDNIWLDGTGHIACAYISFGDFRRGYFYANQLDAFILDRIIREKRTHALPYTANKTGGYDWVDPGKGFVSVAAWYIFAKNGFNPLQLTHVSVK